MKKNILVQIGTRTEKRTRVIPPTYDDEGNIVTEEQIEEYEVLVPIMESQNVEMTQEEIANMQANENQTQEPTAEERMSVIEEAIIEMANTIYGGKA